MEEVVWTIFGWDLGIRVKGVLVMTSMGAIFCVSELKMKMEFLEFEWIWSEILLLLLHAVEVVNILLWEEERRLWVCGSKPWEMSFFLIHEFQKFLTSLSVLPGRCFAIWAHLQHKIKHMHALKFSTSSNVVCMEYSLYCSWHVRTCHRLNQTDGCLFRIDEAQFCLGHITYSSVINNKNKLRVKERIFPWLFAYEKWYHCLSGTKKIKKKKEIGYSSNLLKISFISFPFSHFSSTCFPEFYECQLLSALLQQWRNPSSGLASNNLSISICNSFHTSANLHTYNP